MSAIDNVLIEITRVDKKDDSNKDSDAKNNQNDSVIESVLIQPSNKKDNNDSSNVEQNKINDNKDKKDPKGGDKVVPEIKDPKVLAMKEAFDILDTDRSGFIEINEFKTIMKECGFTDQEILGSIKQSDKNNDGKISFEEFLADYEVISY